jgi:hypothetical protein
MDLGSGKELTTFQHKLINLIQRLSSESIVSTIINILFVLISPMINLQLC